MVEGDEQKRELELAQLRLEYGLRDLTANLLRIARGAGKAYELEQQVFSLNEELQTFRQLAGHGAPADLVHKCLNISVEINRAETDYDYQLRQEGLERTLRGAIQVAASRLMGQRTQEIAGDREMTDGMRQAQEAREAMVRRHRT